MKAIKNIDSLIKRLSLEDSNWQRTVYDATGVILLDSLYLFSNCGYISLDSDSVYSCSSGIDTTVYCEINTPEELIEYIKEMDSYTECLTDISFGKFSKSELFWGIYERILLKQENLDESGAQNWGLYSIGQYEDQVELHMALIPCDSVNIQLDISEDTTLDETLEMLVGELNAEVAEFDWLPEQKIFMVNYSVPNTYEALKEKCSPESVFGWFS